MLVASASVAYLAMDAGEGPVEPDIHAISTEAQFSSMAAPLDISGSSKILTIPFIVDLQSDETPVTWMDPRKTRFHYQYLSENGLTHLPLAEFNYLNYTTDDRRYVLGSVIRYGPGRDVVELWEGDTIGKEHLAATMTALGDAYHRDLVFRPTSDHQRTVAAGLDIAIDEGPGVADGLFVFNTGSSVGTLRMVEDEEIEDILPSDILPSDIVMLSSTPITLDPVAGIISLTPVSPTTHINVLTRTWNVPNVQDPDAAERYSHLVGHTVLFEAQGRSYSIRAATKEEIARDARERKAKAPVLLRADLAQQNMATLSDQDRRSSRAYGAKSANLGFLISLMPEAGGAYEVPPGFTIPFSYYEQHIRRSGLDREIESLLTDTTLLDDRITLKKRLEKLRQAFAERPIDPDTMRRIVTRRHTVLGDRGLFIRSSTNAEDLEGFSGAGLYDTVPNVVSDAELESAVKQVWGSIWNDAAFLSREAAGIDHRRVKAAVIVQLGIDADAAGVILTHNAYSANRRDGVLVSAKKGLGIRVVQGRRMPEQAIYWVDGDSESIDLLSLSDDDTLLEFDRNGGVRERGVRRGQRVIDDETYLRLGRIGKRIEERYGEPADIEWLIVGDTIHLVQVRPYRTSSK